MSSKKYLFFEKLKILQHFSQVYFLVCFFDANHAKFRETMRKTNFSVVSRRFVWFVLKIDRYMRLKYYKNCGTNEIETVLNQDRPEGA